MKAVIFGGDGYIGRRLKNLTRNFDDVVLVDHRQPRFPDVEYADVRQPIPNSIAGDVPPDWIVLLAAVHREPGHRRHEYFETNLQGARNVAAYADAVGCTNIFFFSSSSVYGPTAGPTDEQTPTSPTSPYGCSKLGAELILEGWHQQGNGRRLVICRPGVVYGPGDPGNVLRMIRAIRRGVFVFPGDRRIRKSYAYVIGLIESFDFTVARTEPLIVYNYVERETGTLESLVRAIQDEFGRRRPVPSLPGPLVVGAAYAAQVITRGRSAVHPVRVRKAALPTHVVPHWLIENGFDFRFDFRSSLTHWRSVAPEDFDSRARTRRAAVTVGVGVTQTATNEQASAKAAGNGAAQSPAFAGAHSASGSATVSGTSSPAPLVSVLIVSFDCCPELEICLRSLDAERGSLPFEAIVVDNASSDGTAAAVTRAFPWVRLVANSENVGFARAVNQAMALARGDFFLLLNPDTMLPRGTLAATLAALDERSEVGMLGCKLVRRDGSFDHACKRGFPTIHSAFYYFLGLARLMPRSRRFAQYTVGDLNPDDVGFVDAVNGAFMLVRREAVESVGQMDERFWLYAEDLDWCIRFWERGWKILYWPGSEVVHVKGASAGSWRSFNLNLAFHRSIWLFYVKHHAPNHSRPATLLVFTGIWTKFLSSILWNGTRSLLAYAMRGTGAREQRRRLGVSPRVEDVPPMLEPQVSRSENERIRSGS